MLLKERKFHYDDSLDAWGVHGVGGMLGALLVGVFSQQGAEPRGAPTGCSPADPALLGKQALGLLAVGVYTAVVTLGILFVRRPGRSACASSEDEEREGLDATQHGEAAYTS